MKIADCRPEVQAFAIAMERKLRENDGKKHWRKCSPKYLRRRLAEELNELLFEADSPEDVTDECADIGNFAMMVADRDGGLITRDRKRSRAAT